MSRKNNKMKHYSFESKTESGAFTKICKDMEKSLAWESLSLRQRGLYHYIKSKFTKYSNQDTNQNNLSITTNEAKKLYGDLRTFRYDIDALINAGFIRQVHSGYLTKTASIYGLIDLWKGYGTDDFTVPECYKRYKPPKK